MNFIILGAYNLLNLHASISQSSSLAGTSSVLGYWYEYSTKLPIKHPMSLVWSKSNEFHFAKINFCWRRFQRRKMHHHMNFLALKTSPGLSLLWRWNSFEFGHTKFIERGSINYILIVQAARWKLLKMPSS